MGDLPLWSFHQSEILLSWHLSMLPPEKSGPLLTSCTLLTVSHSVPTFPRHHLYTKYPTLPLPLPFSPHTSLYTALLIALR